MARKRTPLERALDDALDDYGLTRDAIATRLGISVHTLDSWAVYKRHPRDWNQRFALADLVRSQVTVLWPREIVPTSKEECSDGNRV